MEAEQPIITTSPAYPLEDGKSYPSHPFIYRCKACDTDDEKIAYNDAAEVLRRVERGENIKFRQVCDKGHPAIKLLHPKPVKPLGKIAEKVDIITHESICVSISKHRATSQRGMLYTYEAIAGGTMFWAYLKLPENLSNEVKPGLEFSIGRGITRGFGRARITRVEEINVEKEEERIRECLNSERIVFYAISSLASLSPLKNTSYPYPGEIDLNSFGKEFCIEVSGKITFIEAYGKLGTLHCGWDMRNNVERPSIKAALPGSILIGKVAGSGNIARALAILGLIGTVARGQEFFITGVNMITPLKGHPMGGE
jgi:hypothetical protein